MSFSRMHTTDIHIHTHTYSNSHMHDFYYFLVSLLGSPCHTLTNCISYFQHAECMRKREREGKEKERERWAEENEREPNKFIVDPLYRLPFQNSFPCSLFVLVALSSFLPSIWVEARMRTALAIRLLSRALVLMLAQLKDENREVSWYSWQFRFAKIDNFWLQRAALLMRLN